MEICENACCSIFFYWTGHVSLLTYDIVSDRETGQYKPYRRCPGKIIVGEGADYCEYDQYFEASMHDGQENGPILIK